MSTPRTPARRPPRRSPESDSARADDAPSRADDAPSRADDAPSRAGSTRLPTAERRAQIAEAALSLADEVGVPAVSIAAIAERVGVVPSALYRHFPGKDAIHDAMVERVVERLSGCVRCVEERHPDDVLARLDQLLDCHLALLEEHPALSELVFAQGIYGASPERGRRLGRLVEGYLGRVASWVEEGRDSGRLRADLVGQDVALLVLGLVRAPAVVQAIRRQRGGFEVRAAGARAWALLRPCLVSDGRPATEPIRPTHSRNPCSTRPKEET